MKHRLHKLFAAFLAVMLLVSCTSIMAFAANETNSHTYELYQIFTGDYSDGILSNLVWGQNGAYATNGATKVGDAVSDDVIKNLKGYVDTETKTYTDSEKLEAILKYVDLTSTPFRGADNQPTAEDKGTGFVYSDVPAGYYLIKDVDNSQKSTNDKNETVTGTNYTLYVVKAVSGSLLFQPKGSIPTVSKKVEEGTSWLDANSASMGEDVNYQITGTVSDIIADYATYYYQFNDTLSKGLTYKTVHAQDNDKGTLYLLKDGTYTTEAPVTDGGENDTSAKYASTTDKYVANTDDNLKVYLVNGTDKQDVTKYFYVNAAAQTDGTTKLTVAIQDLKQLLNVKDGDAAKYTLNGNSQIVVEYTAVLTKDAVQANGSNDNTVNITYSTDPNNSGKGNENPPDENPKEPSPTTPTGETVDSKTETYTTALVITKKNENDDLLTGAEFTLTGEGTQIAIVTSAVFVEKDESTEYPEGTDFYYKLKDGTYTTTAPVIANDKTDTSANYASTTQLYTKSYTTEVKGAGQTETTITGVTAGDGVVKFTGLGAGTYTLSETKAPAGYNKMSDITFTISFKSDKTFESTYTKGVSYDAKDGEFDMEIIDQKGSTLPRTGGIGTTIFYVVGTILVLSAGILLITKKRMGREVR
jgi:fimbrial isopeptide formation D2 family protein/LPXTG-motif cell wall-anchored protein